MGNTLKIFDSKIFARGFESLDTLVIKMDTLCHFEAKQMDQPEIFKKVVKIEGT